MHVAGTPEDPVVGVHIADGTVRGFATGIQLSNASASGLNALTVTATCSCGILLLDANGNHVNRNIASNKFRRGVCVGNSNGNEFHKNSLNDNARGLSEELDFGVGLFFSHGKCYDLERHLRKRCWKGFC